jgi:hypothetical protein
VPPEPTERHGSLDPSAELVTTAAARSLVDTLDKDAAILHRLDAVRDQDELARGSVGIGKRVRLDELQGFAFL